MVIPRNLKIHLPATANPINTPAVTQHATRAIRIRSAGVSVGVIARKAGTVAKGSTMTKRELVASRMYSGRFTARSVLRVPCGVEGAYVIVLESAPAEQGAKTASVIPWIIFLSGGQIVARTPPNCARAASASPATK